MRNLTELDHLRLRDARVLQMYGGFGDDRGGVFTVKSKIDRVPMRVVASSGDGWDHVSVSRYNRCPNWIEMEQVKHLFFKEDETAMQLHVPASDHINYHPHCLHIWRPTDKEIPRPPGMMVGPTKDGSDG